MPVLPGYSGRSRSAPAPPDWPSLAPGRSEETFVSFETEDKGTLPLSGRVINKANWGKKGK